MKFKNTAANRGLIQQACDEIRRRGKFPYRRDTADCVTIDALETQPGLINDHALAMDSARRNNVPLATGNARAVVGYDRLK